MPSPHFSIVLVAPEIPGNTGSIGRTCVALNLELILIKPYGFELSEKAVRRAGLDYWKHVQLKEYDSLAEFLKDKRPTKDKLFFYSRFANKNYFEAKFSPGCFLIFGSETKSLPEEVFGQFENELYFLPQFSEHIRSLNLSNAATAAAYEAIRQIKF